MHSSHRSQEKLDVLPLICNPSTCSEMEGEDGRNFWKLLGQRAWSMQCGRNKEDPTSKTQNPVGRRECCSKKSADFCMCIRVHMLSTHANRLKQKENNRSWHKSVVINHQMKLHNEPLKGWSKGHFNSIFNLNITNRAIPLNTMEFPL